jgi:cytochrome c-type biogenesis protein CcmH/NrfG
MTTRASESLGGAVVAAPSVEVIDLDSNSPEEDRQHADELLRRALDLEPNRAGTYFVLGKVRESQGRVAEAADAYRTAIKLDRNYAREQNK